MQYLYRFLKKVLAATTASLLHSIKSLLLTFKIRCGIL
jgi:hypothetical protein